MRLPSTPAVNTINKKGGSPISSLCEKNRQAAEALLTLCREKKITLATAESCTGGLIGATLTAIPGSSDVYLGGIVSYANSVKENLLGVKKETLKTVGAVSKETAEQMVCGVREATGATAAVSVTGIAGPGGETPEKPCGLVYIGVSCGNTTKVTKYIFSGDRGAVRRQTVEAALSLLHQAVLSL